MSSTPPSGGIVFVEPLESRIAPTGLLAISGDPGTTATADPHYVTFATTPTAARLGFVPASEYGINTPNLFAIKLTGDGTFNATTGASNGDELVVFNNVTGFNTSVPLIQANKGPVVAFFLNNPNQHGTTTEVAGEVYADELVGVSLGKKDIISINGNVYGDIVTNLLTGGTAVSLTSDGGPGQGINGITMNGNVFGNLLAGGNIKNVTIRGLVDNVLAGTATNGANFNFSGVAGGVTGIIADAAAANHVGANINLLTVNTLAVGGRIQAGDAGFGAVGGSINSLVVASDTDAFNVFGGAGGGGNVTTPGGAGGAINGATIQGTANTAPNHLIFLEGGHGGDNGAGKGGNGGAVANVGVGFDTFDTVNSVFTPSANLLAQDVEILGGTGGTALKGGKGGAVNTAQVIGSIQYDGTANPEIEVFGGAGGAAAFTDHGKGGKGGSLVDVTAENLNALIAQASTSLTVTGPSILVQGGAGGADAGGGSVNGLDLLGTILTVNGGAGGAGPGSGGAGGSLNTIGILSMSNLLAHQVTLDAGAGANGAQGTGGAGGLVNGVTMADADIATLTINGGTSANGGLSANGKGGAGGAVTNVSLFDSAPSVSAPLPGVAATPVGTVTVRSGTGGDGTAGGGAGGAVDTFQILGSDFSFGLVAGAGGRSSGPQGKGGSGGALSNVGVSNTGDMTNEANVTALGAAVTAGAGGDGTGTSKGGRGGSVTAVNVRAVYNVTETAGAAGNGPGGARGGGSFTASAAVALEGMVSATAGAGGQSSGGASNGGSITGFIAEAETTISMIAGNGGSGGAGGSITNCGTTLDEVTGLSNFGNFTVTAGNGSNLNAVAGAGGSITGFTGFVAAGGTTALTAGAGGGGGASGQGGGISTIKLTGNSQDLGTTQIVTIDAGNAGAAGGAARGRSGGDVNGVTIYDLDAGTVVQHIAAGDGVAGTRKGGHGGSINSVNVGIPGDGADDDIGVRSGVGYSYAVGGAGGLFAGVGGAGAKHTGNNGSVTNVTATAIASIVAGKGTPQLCNNVDAIFLEGLTPTTTDATGAFTNFDTANLVGSITNPNAANASVFVAGDGLIAATTLTINRNFVPEALLTVDAAGNLELVDYQQPNPVPVTTAAPAFLA